MGPWPGTARKRFHQAGGFLQSMAPGADHTLTPMVRQYQQIKAQHPDDLLLFRIGDFYETFGDDAKAAAEILGITLTRKHIGQGRTLPLAGIPYHALDQYLARLIRAGRRVAICDQVEDAAAPGRDAKAPVRREVTRVVTPGTILESGLLEDKRANYIAAVARHQGNWGLAVAELSTGALGATEFSGDDARETLMSELARLAPAELLATEEDWGLLEANLRETFGLNAGQTGAAILRTRADKGMLRLDTARATLLEQLGVATLQGYGAEDSPAAVCAAGGLVTYLRETQRRGLGHIRELRIYSVRDMMVLDATTQRSLELVRNLVDGGRSATLLDVLDQTRTPMGGRLLRQWILQPLQNLEVILARQEAIESLLGNAPAREQIREGLRGVRDLERILGRIHCGTANARDLMALAASLREVPALKSALLRLAGHGSDAGALRPLGERLQTLAPLADALESALVPDPPATVREGGMVRDGFHAELDELRAVNRDGKGWITRMRAAEIERTGITSLKIGYNRVFGYYIEISKTNLDKVPADYIRRQTLTNGERFITPALKEKEELILGAQEKIQELEFRLFEGLRQQVIDQTGPLQALARDIAEIDALVSLAEAALRGGYIRPTVDGSDLLKITAGRHPVLESLLTDRPFVANDVRLDSKEQQLWLITGPNMAGKSTFIRQVALLTLMAHVGSFIPAKTAHIGLVDRIFTRVGATDYLARGQSTFLVEMTETANILHNATDKSLVILDEIGRGTSTYDGLSIAWAVVEYLHDKPRRRAKTLFATHYHELTELEGRMARIRNYNVAVREGSPTGGDEITFLYHIIPGGADRSYGIYAAQLAGMPQETLARAREILFQLECARRTPDDGALGPIGDVTAGAEGNAGAAGAAKDVVAALLRHRSPVAHDVDVLQLDLFTPALPPVFGELAGLDITQLTPLQALQILDELIKCARELNP
jgi:DNA mismatch repair protein MutS